MRVTNAVAQTVANTVREEINLFMFLSPGLSACDLANFFILSPLN
jgi:hypothetical protein